MQTDRWWPFERPSLVIVHWTIPSVGLEKKLDESNPYT